MESNLWRKNFYNGKKLKGLIKRNIEDVTEAEVFLKNVEKVKINFIY